MVKDTAVTTINTPDWSIIRLFRVCTDAFLKGLQPKISFLNQ